MLLITGITGLTGRFLYQEIKQQNPDLKVRYFVRKTSDISWMDPKEDFAFGELTSVEDIHHALQDVQTVLHLAPRGNLQEILSACQGTGVNRIFYVNSTGIYSKFKSSSHIDIRNEEALLKSGYVYTIIRPSMIYGNHQDGNIHLLAKMIRKTPIFPIIGKGQGLMHPIYAQDLAKVLVSALNHEELTRNQAYDVAGKAPLAYQELLSLISKTMGKKTWFIHFPYSWALALGKIADHIPNRILTYEKVLRLNEDKNFDSSKAQKELGFSPIAFDEGIRYEIQALREHKVI